MPCRDGGPDCDTPTPSGPPDWMLCEAMIIIEKNGLIEECSAQLIAWWKQHSRKERDRVRREAAQKLSYQERKALGIDENGNRAKTKRHTEDD